MHVILMYTLLLYGVGILHDVFLQIDNYKFKSLVLWNGFRRESSKISMVYRNDKNFVILSLIDRPWHCRVLILHIYVNFRCFDIFIA